MSRGPTTFRQRDVAAAIRAARRAGIEVARIKIERDGTITIISGKPEEPDTTGAEVNEWDSAK
jgi:hypothetical protein